MVTPKKLSISPPMESKLCLPDFKYHLEQSDSGPQEEKEVGTFLSRSTKGLVCLYFHRTKLRIGESWGSAGFKAPHVQLQVQVLVTKGMA